MNLKNGKPSFKTKHIQPLWSSKITDLEGLRARMSNTILVAFDIEASIKPRKISEMGLAILFVGENTPRVCAGRAEFFNKNNVQTFTMEIHKRNKKCYEHKRHGKTIYVENELQAGPAIEKILSDFQSLGKLILLGYDMQVEFKWISEHAPSLASYFSAWLDVQEFVAAQCGVFQLGLTDAVQGLGIIDNRRHSSQHSAANDGVRDLAVLAGLLSGRKLITPPQCKEKVKEVSSLPLFKKFGFWKRYPFSVRLAPADGGQLPEILHRDLAKLFASYDLKAVGIRRRDDLQIWWMAFYTLEGLSIFIRDNESVEVQGKALKIVQVTAIK